MYGPSLLPMNPKWRQARGMGLRAYEIPTSPAVQNPSPVAGSATNAGITVANVAQPSQDPLSYVSPQQAVAAGLDPQTVAAAWQQALWKYPSPQAAISAGFPAGVVNQYWTAAPPAPAKPSGIPAWLIAAAGLIAVGVLAASSAKGEDL